MTNTAAPLKLTGYHGETLTITGAVENYRAAARALRNLDGGTRATLRADVRRDEELRHLERQMLDSGARGHRLVGLLVEERRQLDRITGKGKTDTARTRPEIAERVARIRAQICAEIRAE